MTWGWQRRRQELAEQVTEALESGVSPLKTCRTCKHLGPNTVCHRNPKTYLVSPVTGRRSVVRWIKPHCESQREGAGYHARQPDESKCGLEALFWEPEPRAWKRTWQSWPAWVQFSVLWTAGSVALCVLVVALILATQWFLLQPA